MNATDAPACATLSRRAFILGAMTWPLIGSPGAALAQTAKTAPVIGVLHPRAPTEPFYQAFLQGMHELGYVPGKNVRIDYRQGELNRMPDLAAELVRNNVNVIFASTPQAAQAARSATATIPIVVAVIGDPVGSGLAASLAHPGGNVTGLTALGSGLGGKRLELLKEIVPQVTRVAVLWNPSVPDKVIEWKEMQPAARALKVELLSIEVRAPADFDPAFEQARRARPQAVIALGEPLVFGQIVPIVEFTRAIRVPAMFNWREAVEAGALIAYGPDISDLYRRAATYVVKILKGAKAGDLPIEEPSRFDFVINLKTARALGIQIPQAILVRADRVIE